MEKDHPYLLGVKAITGQKFALKGLKTVQKFLFIQVICSINVLTPNYAGLHKSELSAKVALMVLNQTHKVKVRYSLTSVAQTMMMTSAKLARF